MEPDAPVERESPATREIGPRRQAREATLQILYALDVAGSPGSEAVPDALRDYWAHMEGPAVGRAYADAAVLAVTTQRDAIDAAIRAANSQWRLERMSVVDRNVLRLAAWEIGFGGEVPATVAIDEAVDLARRFGSEESPAFANGVLDRLARDAGKL